MPGDQGPAGASNQAENEPPSAAVAALHLDDVTGRMVSKSELKKLQKQRELAEKKEKRAAAAPPKAVKKRPADDDEMELTPNVCLRFIKYTSRLILS